MPQAPRREPAPPDVPWRRRVTPHPVVLFRFSALTFNSHRIHYDRPWATDVEGYPGLVVHGPLQAMLLMDLARRHQPDRRPARFRFRGVRPLFHFERLQLLGRPAETGGHELFTANGAGAVTMQADIRWADG